MNRGTKKKNLIVLSLFFFKKKGNSRHTHKREGFIIIFFFPKKKRNIREENKKRIARCGERDSGSHPSCLSVFSNYKSHQAKRFPRAARGTRRRQNGPRPLVPWNDRSAPTAEMNQKDYSPLSPTNEEEKNECPADTTHSGKGKKKISFQQHFLVLLVNKCSTRSFSLSAVSSIK